jgi:hypothetical protein
MHRSFDGGETWRRSVNGTFYGNRMKMDYNNPSKILVSSDQGIWMTTNQALTLVAETTAETWYVNQTQQCFDTVYALAIGKLLQEIQSFDAVILSRGNPSFPTKFQPFWGLLAVTPANA